MTHMQVAVNAHPDTKTYRTAEKRSLKVALSIVRTMLDSGRPSPDAPPNRLPTCSSNCASVVTGAFALTCTTR